MMTEHERQQIDRRMRALEAELNVAETELKQMREVNRQLMDPIVRLKMLEPMPAITVACPRRFLLVERRLLNRILPQLHWNSEEYRELLKLMGPEEGDQ